MTPRRFILCANICLPLLVESGTRAVEMYSRQENNTRSITFAEDGCFSSYPPCDV